MSSNSSASASGAPVEDKDAGIEELDPEGKNPKKPEPVPASSMMDSRTAHLAMAVAFSSMAIPCLTHLDAIASAFLTGGALNNRERLLLRCFGSQALLTGIAIGVGKWDERAYQIWIASILPFFAFDAAAYAGGFLTKAGAVGDALGNIAFIGLSWFAMKKH